MFNSKTSASAEAKAKFVGPLVWGWVGAGYIVESRPELVASTLVLGGQSPLPQNSVEKLATPFNTFSPTFHNSSALLSLQRSIRFQVEC